MFDISRNVGVEIGLSMAVLVIASHSWAAPDPSPVPSLQSLDLAVAVPESSVDLGGPSWSATVLTRPVLETVPGLAPAGELSVRWTTRRDVSLIVDGLGERRRDLLLEAANLEASDARGVPTRMPGSGATVLGLR